MPFQGDIFTRTQNFTRDRDLGPPENAISAPKVDDELSGIASALTIVKTAISTVVSGAGTGADTLKKLYDLAALRAWFPALSAGIANTYLRVNAAGTAFESRTTAQALVDIGAASKDTPIITTTLQIRQRDPRFGISLQRGDGTEIAGIFRDDASGGGLSIYSNGSGSLFMNNVGMAINGQAVWTNGNDGAGSGLDADLLDGQDGSFYANVVARLGYTPWDAGRMANTHSLGFTGANDAVPYIVRNSDRVSCNLYSEFNYPGWPSEIPEKFNAIRLTGGGMVVGVPVPSGAVVTFVGKTGGGSAYDMGYKYLQGFSPSRGWISAVNEG